jgi:hypothetical protein
MLNMGFKDDIEFILKTHRTAKYMVVQRYDACRDQAGE